MGGKLDVAGELCIVALMLATHEALAVVSILPMLVRLRSPKGACLLLGLYGLAWLCNFGLEPGSAFAAQTHLGGHSAFYYLRTEFGWAMLGVWVAYKFVWIPMLALLGHALKQGDKATSYLLVSNIGLALLQLAVATDTSRLAGMAFLSALLGYAYWVNTRSDRLRFWFAVAQIAMPSFYIGLCCTTPAIAVFPGLYYKMVTLITAW